MLTSEPVSGLSGPGGDDGRPVLNLSDVTAGGKAINQTEEERTGAKQSPVMSNPPVSSQNQQL